MDQVSRHIKPLSGEAEWTMWKNKIRDILDYHEGALDVIDGKLEKPEPLADGATETEKKAFKEKADLYRKANSYAKSMITSAVTDNVYRKIMDKTTAHDAWNALKDQFEASDKDQLFQLCTDFFAFTWTLGEDVSTHIAKLKSLFFELNNGLKLKKENTLPELMVISKVLHILPEQFKTFKSSWMLLSKEKDKTLDELTVQLCMFERNFAKDSSTDQEAFIANTKVRKNKVVNNSTCNYCGEKSHWVRQCKKWIADGRPPKNKPKISAKTKQEDASTVAFSVEEVVVIEDEPTLALSSEEVMVMARDDRSDWWVDNGATKHVTNTPMYFTKFQEFETPCSMKAAGKEVLGAIGKGTIQVMSLNKYGKEELLTFSDVWYVPGISKNLFSVLAAHDRNKEESLFSSKATKCTFRVGNVEVRGSREVRGGLYKLEIKPLVPEQEVHCSVAEADKSILQLYHERWGHQDKRFVRTKLEKEMNIRVKMDHDICEACIYGKIHRLPFGTRERATYIGERFSADVVGPFDMSFQRYRYLLMFKDNYSRMRFSYLLRQKSEVKEKLKDVIALAKNSGHSIKEFLSDGGGEFDNEDVRSLLRANGIMQKLTAPYTPEQNGGSERENRTVVEMARTFKYSNSDVAFPPGIWAELVRTATYVLNRTGKSSLENVSPYEVWYGKRPRIKHLRVIASACYFHIPVQKRRKMDKKAMKGYLVGYEGDECYRIWVKEESKIYLSRDVKFYENLHRCTEEPNAVQLTPEDQDKIVELPMRSPEPEANKEESRQKEQRNDDEGLQIQMPENTEDETSENSERQDTSESEVEHEKEKQQLKLRDRQTLKKPYRYEDEYIHLAEEMLCNIETPESYKEAVGTRERSEWKKAMDSEISSLKENQTWELEELPPGSKALPSKWVYKVKINPDGSVDKFKARLVIKGFAQRQGIDFNQTFSPVAKLSTIRSVLSVAASEKMYLKQFDVVTAFLYGEIEETIYMRQPEGYSDGTQRVCKLKRSLYGLKQAPRCWNKRFNDYLLKLGFKVSEADPCLYIRNREEKMFLALYVDDGLISSTSKEDLEKVLTDLGEEFKITSKTASFYLGLEIEKSEFGIRISQKSYAEKVLERFEFSQCRPVSTPMIKPSETTKIQSGKEEQTKIVFPYREAIGALMYLMVGTRPDLAYAVGYLSRFLENPSSENVVQVKRILRYLAGTKSLGIVYRNTPCPKIESFSDADFGGCINTGRSTSGTVFMFAKGAISWSSQRQSIVATSTTEAEIIAASEATKELVWLTRLFQEIWSLSKVPVLQVDNSAAVKLAHNPELHRRTKHIRIRHFFVREKVIEGSISVQQVSTEEQLADIMTKPLAKSRLQMLRTLLGLS